MSKQMISLVFFFFNDTATTEIYTLSLHDALPICARGRRHVTVRALEIAPLRKIPRHRIRRVRRGGRRDRGRRRRSEEHTSELQSPCNLVCRLLLEKKYHNDHTFASSIFAFRSPSH